MLGRAGHAGTAGKMAVALVYDAASVLQWIGVPVIGCKVRREGVT